MNRLIPYLHLGSTGNEKRISAGRVPVGPASTTLATAVPAPRNITVRERKLVREVASGLKSERRNVRRRFGALTSTVSADQSATSGARVITCMLKSLVSSRHAAPVTQSALMIKTRCRTSRMFDSGMSA